MDSLASQIGHCLISYADCPMWVFGIMIGVIVALLIFDIGFARYVNKRMNELDDESMNCLVKSQKEPRSYELVDRKRKADRRFQHYDHLGQECFVLMIESCFMIFVMLISWFCYLPPLIAIGFFVAYLVEATRIFLLILKYK